MAASNEPVGVDHPTVVPAALEPEPTECQVCGEPLDEH